MHIAVIGSGYVGLVAAACFADSGNDVVCVDIDERKIAALKAGTIPIYEPGLEEMVERNARAGRLSFTTELTPAVKPAEVVFIAVGTPEGENGDADLQYVLAAARQIGQAIQRYTVVVDKSTVPVGTADLVRKEIASVTDVEFDVVSNPEFLKEGAAIEDFVKPDRVVIGTESERAREIMGELYAPFCRKNDRIIFMDTKSAEMTKYAANAMLATRISFMNEIARLCERVGADAEAVRQGMGTDSRIGLAFLFPGVGYGGSCLHRRETVLVRENGQAYLTTLQELFESHAFVRTDEGVYPSMVVPEGMEVFSWRPGRDTPEFLPVQAITRRPFEGDLLEVVTKMGRRVRVTPDHPFVVADSAGNRRGIKLASELTEEDWLPVAQGAPEGRAEPVRIPLLAGMRHADAIALDIIVRPRAGALESLGLSASQIQEKLEGLREQPPTRGYDILRSGALRLDEARLLGVSLAGASASTVRNGTYVPLEFEANEAFWRIVGLYLSEGHVNADRKRRRITWSFHPRDEMELVDEVANYWRSLGVKVDVHSGSTTMQVMVSSRLLAGLWLGGLRLGKDCYSHEIPDQIWEAPESYKRALLSGIWHGDGSWSLIGGGPSCILEWGSVSRPLADGLLRLLGDLGVAARLKVGRTAKSTRDTYWVAISGAEQIEKVLEFVPEKERHQVTFMLGRQKKRIAPTGYRRHDPNAAWVRISKINKRPYQNYVYSLEVPGAETFVTTGGLVVHNCFPKDVKALYGTARENGLEFPLLRAVGRVNEEQKRILLQKALKHFGNNVEGKLFGVWGLAFKPKTDDMREAPAITLIEGLLGKGARVVAHDPVAHHTARKIFGDRIAYSDSPYGAVEGVDALFIVTEWNEFRRPDFDRMKSLMKSPVVFDGRNVFDPRKMRERGFTHYGIGRGTDPS